MPLSTEADKFVEVATSSLPRVAEIIAAFSDEDRGNAYQVAERCYVEAATRHGCDALESERWVTAIMRKLRALVAEANASNDKL
jgi:hypothetical protein